MDKIKQQKRNYTPVHIRSMIRRRDMPEMLQIENDNFDNPWTEDDFVRCLRQRRCIYYGMVAELEEKIVGFFIYKIHKLKLHIVNFCVHAEYQRSGIGSQMINKLIGELSLDRRDHITLEVRETNVVAQLFFSSHWFKVVSVFRNFYDDSEEDAYYMEYRLNPSRIYENTI